MNEEEYSDRLHELLELGVITVEGVDPEGEIVYALHEEKARELAPDLWESHERWIDDSLIDLYKKGLAEIEYDEDLNATINFSDEGFELAKSLGIIPIEMPDTDIPND